MFPLQTKASWFWILNVWRLMAPVSSQAMCAGRAGSRCVLDQWATVGGPVVTVRSLRLAAITASLSRLDQWRTVWGRPAKILTIWKHKPSLGTQRGFPPPLFPCYGHFWWPPRAEVCVEDLEPSRSQSDPVSFLTQRFIQMTFKSSEVSAKILLSVETIQTCRLTNSSLQPINKIMNITFSYCFVLSN